MTAKLLTMKVRAPKLNTSLPYAGFTRAVVMEGSYCNVKATQGIINRKRS